MIFHDIISLVSGLLQLIAACYALRLSRILGTARAGWMLFGAFTLLAILHLLPVIPAFAPGAGAAARDEIIYAIISLLLLAGMFHVEMIFKQRQRLEREEKALRERLEQEVEKKTAHLIRAVDALQAETDARKRMEAEVAAHIGLLELSRDPGGRGPDALAGIRF